MKSVLKTSFSLKSEDDSPSQSPGKKKDLNALIEAQQVSDILRANNDLIAMKSFRIQNEKMYDEKELNALRRKEIREPLEEALTKLEILTERLSRREVMIDKLRRHISLDSVHFKSMDMEITKLRNVDLKDTEHKVEVLMDEMANMTREVDKQANQLIRCKRTIKFQIEKNKDLQATNEKLEFYYKEKLRSMEKEMNSYTSLIDSKDSKIAQLVEARDLIASHHNDLQLALDDVILQVHAGRKVIKEKEDQMTEVEAEKNVIAGHWNDSLKLYNDKKEECHVLTETNHDLQTRYDNLIHELDKMVEVGYTIPDPNTPQGNYSLHNTESSANLSVSDHSTMRGKLKKQKSYKMRNVVGLINNNGNTTPLASPMPTTRKTSMGTKKQGSSNGNGSARNSYLGGDNGGSEEDHNESDEEYLQAQLLNSVQAVTGVQPLTKDSKEQKLLGLFTQRKADQDAVAEELRKASSAIRMRETLEKNITDLSTALKLERTMKEKLQQEIGNSKDELVVLNKVKHGELETMCRKVNSLDKQIETIAEQLQSERNKYVERESEIHAQISELKCTIEQQQATIQDQQQEFELYKHNNQQDDMLKPIIQDEDFLELATNNNEEDAAENNDVDFNDSTDLPDPIDNTRGDGKDGDYDMFAYMYAWKNVQINSQETQTMGAMESFSVGTQFELNEVFPERLAEMSSQTVSGDVEYPVEHYLETLYSDFVLLSRNTVPYVNIATIHSDTFDNSNTTATSGHVANYFANSIGNTNNNSGSNTGVTTPVRSRPTTPNTRGICRPTSAERKEYGGGNSNNNGGTDIVNELRSGSRPMSPAGKRLSVLSGGNRSSIVSPQDTRRFSTAATERYGTPPDSRRVSILEVSNPTTRLNSPTISRRVSGAAIVIPTQINEINSTTDNNNSGKNTKRSSDETEEEYAFRHRRIISYCSMLNEIRNIAIKDINSTKTWNSLNSRMLIRCLDLILQTVHNLLSPLQNLAPPKPDAAFIEARSDYDELLRAVDKNNEEYDDTIGMDDEDDGDGNKNLQNVFAPQLKGEMYDTFKLTQTLLIGETNTGAPRGVLNPSSQRKKSFAINYMNRSPSPRRDVPDNVDSVLESINKVQLQQFQESDIVRNSPELINNSTTMYDLLHNTIVNTQNNRGILTQNNNNSNNNNTTVAIKTNSTTNNINKTTSIDSNDGKVSPVAKKINFIATVTTVDNKTSKKQNTAGEKSKVKFNISKELSVSADIAEPTNTVNSTDINNATAAVYSDKDNFKTADIITKPKRKKGVSLYVDNSDDENQSKPSRTVSARTSSGNDNSNSNGKSNGNSNSSSNTEKTKTYSKYMMDLSAKITPQTSHTNLNFNNNNDPKQPNTTSIYKSLIGAATAPPRTAPASTTNTNNNSNQNSTNNTAQNTPKSMKFQSLFHHSSIDNNLEKDRADYVDYTRLKFATHSEVNSAYHNNTTVPRNNNNNEFMPGTINNNFIDAFGNSGVSGGHSNFNNFNNRAQTASVAITLNSENSHVLEYEKHAEKLKEKPKSASGVSSSRSNYKFFGDSDNHHHKLTTNATTQQNNINHNSSINASSIINSIIHSSGSGVDHHKHNNIDNDDNNAPLTERSVALSDADHTLNTHAYHYNTDYADLDYYTDHNTYDNTLTNIDFSTVAGSTNYTNTSNIKRMYTNANKSPPRTQTLSNNDYNKQQLANRAQTAPTNVDRTNVLNLKAQHVVLQSSPSTTQRKQQNNTKLRSNSLEVPGGGTTNTNGNVEDTPSIILQASMPLAPPLPISVLMSAQQSKNKLNKLNSNVQISQNNGSLNTGSGSTVISAPNSGILNAVVIDKINVPNSSGNNFNLSQQYSTGYSSSNAVHSVAHSGTNSKQVSRPTTGNANTKGISPRVTNSSIVTTPMVGIAGNPK